MKALTIRQPWASRIIAGTKPSEHRSWRSEAIIGQRIAIHAGSKREEPGDEPLSAMIGTVLIASVEEDDDGNYHWHVAEPIACKPLTRKGRLSLWLVDEAARRHLVAAERAFRARSK